MLRHRLAAPLETFTLAVFLIATVSACGSDRTTARVETVDVGVGDVPAAPTLRGERFCEVTALIFDTEVGTAGIELWSTHDLNDCPADAWELVDPGGVRAELGATFVGLDGPQFWLADDAEEVGPPDAEVREIDGLTMRRIAALTVSGGQTETPPYVAEAVLRGGRFTFNAGAEVYELTDPSGIVYTMLSYSGDVDPTLAAADLPTLAPRLELPEGWDYVARTLEAATTVVLSGQGSTIEDALGNRYARSGILVP